VDKWRFTVVPTDPETPYVPTTPVVHVPIWRMSSR